VNPATTVTATFSEAVQSNTISIVLKDAANNTIAGTVSYDPATRTVTFTPTSPLTQGVTYTATVSGAQDLAGNTMTNPFTWSFTTQPAASLSEPFGVASKSGGVAQVTMYNPDRTVRFTTTPFGPNHRRPVRIATGDVTGDGVPDVVAVTPGVAARRIPARVAVIDGTNGSILSTPTLTLGKYAGQVSVAVGDLTGDGVAEIALGTNRGGPHVRVVRGDDFVPLVGFRAGAASGFKGRTQVSIGEMTGDNNADLVVSAQYGAGARVYGYRGESLAPGTARSKAFATFTLGGGYVKGLLLTVGDVTGDDRADLVLGSVSRAPSVAVFSGQDLVQSNTRTRVASFAPPSGLRAGVQVAVQDIDGDGVGDVLTNSGDLVSAFKGSATMPTVGPPTMLFSFDPNPLVVGGVWIG
jgi:hypothetical protein